MSRATAQDLRAIRFYAETLEMTIAYRSDEMGWAQTAPGRGQLALERVAPSDQEGRALAGRGVDFIGPPEKQPWGGVLAHLRDPDGNVLTLLGSAD